MIPPCYVTAVYYYSMDFDKDDFTETSFWIFEYALAAAAAAARSRSVGKFGGKINVKAVRGTSRRKIAQLSATQPIARNNKLDECLHREHYVTII